MRARHIPRVPTAAKLAIGATVLAFPATAVAVTTSGTDAAPAAPAGSLYAAHPSAVTYGHKTVVRGTAPVSAAGSSVALEYRPALTAGWRTVSHGSVLPNGHFALSARVVRSGSLQVVSAVAGTRRSQLRHNRVSTGQVAGTSTVSGTATTRPRLHSSTVRHVTVKPKLALSRTSADAVVGKPADIHGRLLPGVAGRRLVLEVKRGGRWVKAATGRTRRDGAFNIDYRPGVSPTQDVHVAFAGDKLNSRANSRPEAVSAMAYAEVSWYEDAGNTACGFHATYGIASRTLPCGTKVAMSYHGHSVVATVDDRGPYVYSRLYDLNQTVAAKLGMYGVATILASV